MSITSELKDKIFKEIEHLEAEMTKSLCRILRFPAVSPHVGGQGEEIKAREVYKLIEELGLSGGAKLEWIRIPDEKSQTGNRVSLILRTPGRTRQRLWFLNHLDVLSAGDRTLWDTDPFMPVVKNGRIYARGANDNGQSGIAMLYALKTLKDLNITPEYEVCLGFMADVLTGSCYGIEPMVKKRIVDFSSDDMILVPDGGESVGDFIQIAEKWVLHMEFSIRGQQTHASLPGSASNACRAANIFSVELDEALHKTFPDRDELFSPETSTFEPTRRYTNVVSANIVPGTEKLSFDCRLLPRVKLDDVINTVENVMKNVMSRFNIEIELKIIMRSDPAPPTSQESPIAKLVEKAVSEALNVKPRFGGVGIATFSTVFRREGIPAAAWEQNASGQAQKPNEYAEIKHMLNNAKVFALMMLGEQKEEIVDQL